jgi:hypothetical protein
MGWAEVFALQGTNGFEGAQNAYRAVIFSGIGDGVNMGASANRGGGGIASLPADERVADGIGADGQPGFLAFSGKPGASTEISGRKNDTGDDGRLGFGDLREFVDFRLQTALIDL